MARASQKWGLGAGDGDRTRINGLEGRGNSHYTTPAQNKGFVLEQIYLS